MVNKRPGVLHRSVIADVVISLALAVSSPALAGDDRADRSYSSIVDHIKGNYSAKRQGSLGFISFARLFVKMARPAGVKDFKLTMLRDVDYSRGPHPESPDFHEFVRSTIHPSWEPLVQYSSRKQKQWSYLFSAQEKDDVKILVVVMQEHDAFVLQFKFSPQKLSEFVNDPKIFGITLKDEKSNTPDPKPDSEEKTPKPNAPDAKPESQDKLSKPNDAGAAPEKSKPQT